MYPKEVKAGLGQILAHPVHSGNIHSSQMRKEAVSVTINAVFIGLKMEENSHA